MPIKECQENNKPGFKYGDTGKCYTYDPTDDKSKNLAKEKAAKQGRAIEIRKHMGFNDDESADSSE